MVNLKNLVRASLMATVAAGAFGGAAVAQLDQTLSVARNNTQEGAQTQRRIDQLDDQRTDIELEYRALLEQIESLCDESPLHCVLIDEAQFLTKEQVFQLGEVTDKLNIPVLAYGLRTDFQGEPFEGSKYLLAWSDNLKELKAICDCGSKATMVVRFDEAGNAVTEGSQIEIGGNDRYVSMCRRHFKENYFG